MTARKGQDDERGLARVYIDERILRCYHPGGVASIASVRA